MEPEKQGRCIIMGVTRLLLLGPFIYVLKSANAVYVKNKSLLKLYMKLKVKPAINTDFVVTVSTFATDGQKIGTSFFTGTERVHHGKGILHIFNLSLGKRRSFTEIMAKFVQSTDTALKWYWFSFFFFFFWRLIFWISRNTVFVLVLVRITEVVRWRIYFFAHDLVFIWRDYIVNAAKQFNDNFKK